MTPNMMNTKISPHLTNQLTINVAKDVMQRQLDGTLDNYIVEAKKVCEKYEIKVCDCYKKWKTLSENGVDVTELLANKINHPTREMNWLFAYSLVETMFS